MMLRMRVPLLLIASSLLLGATGIAHAAEWRMDAAGSTLEYIAAFQKARVSGTFKEFDTRVRFDANRLADSLVDVTVVMASADMIDADANKAIQGPDWFDSARFTRAVFHASDIRRVEENRYVARGTLTVKGVEQPIEIPFTWKEAGDAAALAGELTVKRADFHIGLGEWAPPDVVGPDVTVKFSVSLRKAR
jgi:polyisoprenoid-binding protein YceI